MIYLWWLLSISGISILIYNMHKETTWNEFKELIMVVWVVGGILSSVGLLMYYMAKVFT